MEVDTRSILEAFLGPVSNFSASPGPKHSHHHDHPHNSESSSGPIPSQPPLLSTNLNRLLDPRVWAPPPPTRGIADDVISVIISTDQTGDGRHGPGFQKADDLTEDFFSFSLFSLVGLCPPPARMDEAPSSLRQTCCDGVKLLPQLELSRSGLPALG